MASVQNIAKVRGGVAVQGEARIRSGSAVRTQLAGRAHAEVVLR